MPRKADREYQTFVMLVLAVAGGVLTVGALALFVWEIARG